MIPDTTHDLRVTAFSVCEFILLQALCPYMFRSGVHSSVLVGSMSSGRKFLLTRSRSSRLRLTHCTISIPPDSLNKKKFLTIDTLFLIPLVP